MLNDTIDFNERIIDPKSWQKKLRDRNAEEQKHMQDMRTARRAKLIHQQTVKGNVPQSASVQEKNGDNNNDEHEFFNDMKGKAAQIFK